MQQLNLEQYWAEKGLPAGLGVHIRCRIPEVIAVPLLEVQPAHVIGDRKLGCIGAPDSPPGALHAAWPPVHAVPVLGRRSGVNLRNQSVCATPFACLCVLRDPGPVRGEGHKFHAIHRLTAPIVNNILRPQSFAAYRSILTPSSTPPSQSSAHPGPQKHPLPRPPPLSPLVRQYNLSPAFCLRTPHERPRWSLLRIVVPYLFCFLCIS